MKVKIGDKVVFPGCGVGVVDARETLELADTRVETWRIAIQDDATIWVPTDALVDKGVRPVMDAEGVPRTWEILTSQVAPSRRRPWPQRRRRYSELMLEGTPAALARLLGELAAVRRNNVAQKKAGLSFSEKRLFEQARGLLVGEIAAARGVATEIVEQRFDKLTAAAAA